MTTLPLQLDRYFFPLQEVRANPEHNAAGNRRGAKVQMHVNSARIEDRPNAYAVDLVVSLDEEKSENPPYFFKIHAFAILVSDEDQEEGEAQLLAVSTGASVLAGAVREHLASMTARGPWGPFLLAPMSPQSLQQLEDGSPGGS